MWSCLVPLRGIEKPLILPQEADVIPAPVMQQSLFRWQNISKSFAQ